VESAHTNTDPALAGEGAIFGGEEEAEYVHTLESYQIDVKEG